MSRVNLLQITGDAVVTEVHDCEGRCNIALHLEVYNPSATASVTIVDHKRYYLTPGGWVEGGPWGSSDFYGMGPTVPPATRRTFTTTSPWEVGMATYVLLDVKLSAGADTKDLIVQIPITMPPGVPWTELAAGLAAPAAPPYRPEPLPVVHDLYPIFMLQPVDVFPVMDGTQGWLILTGQIPNPWGASFSLNSFGYVLEDAAGKRQSGSLPLKFLTDQTDSAGNPIWVDFTQQDSTAGMFSFNHAISVPAASIAGWQWVTLTVERFTPGQEFSVRIAIADDCRNPHPLRFPVDNVSGGEWQAWNAPAVDGFNCHNGNQSERYALDLVALKNGNTMVNPAGSDRDNSNFLAHGKPVRAIDDGVVAFVRKDIPEGLGRHGYKLPQPNGQPWPSDIPAGGNVVVLQHANQRYSVYAHLIPESATNPYPALGKHFVQGQQIGLLGNAGSSSEPHLHLACWTFDHATGFHRVLPLAFSNITSPTGTALPGVVAGDNHIHVT